MLEATFYIALFFSLVFEYFLVDFQFTNVAEMRNRLTVNRLFLFGLLSGSLDSWKQPTHHPDLNLWSHKL